MSNPKAEKFRALAEKARAEAQKAKDGRTLQELYDIAERYDRLAKRAEAQAGEQTE